MIWKLLSLLDDRFQRACLPQALSSSFPQSAKLSMCVRSSSQVITPGVGSGGTKLGQAAHFGYAPTSLHISSHRPASLFCTRTRFFRSAAEQDCSPCTSFTCFKRFLDFFWMSEKSAPLSSA